MKYAIKIVILISCLWQVNGQASFKTMFYNVLNYPLQTPADRVDNLELIIGDYQPDVFMVCEINNESGADAILTSIQNVNPNFTRAAYVENTSDDSGSNQNDLQNMLYFDSTKFILESQTEITTDVRDFNHYVLKLNTVDQLTNPVILNVFIVHLKSSSGTTNEAIRFGMVQDFVAYLEGMPNDSYILFGGDLNFYTSSEDGFVELLDGTNNITFEDPANRIGSWHNNQNYLDVFTQSTRTQTGLGGATGGFDDRFDFILTSENMSSNSELFYVPDTYEVFGNNNNSDCYNSEINSSDCAGATYDQTIRDALYFMSDHLPVTLSLETSETLLSTTNQTLSTALTFSGSNIIEHWLYLNIDPLKIESKHINIVNSIGQIIITSPIENLNQLKINVSNLAKGMYFVVPANKRIEPLKFIKN